MPLSTQEEDLKAWVIKNFRLSNPDSLTVEEWKIFYKVIGAIFEALIEYRTV